MRRRFSPTCIAFSCAEQGIPRSYLFYRALNALAQLDEVLDESRERDQRRRYSYWICHAGKEFTMGEEMSG